MEGPSSSSSRKRPFIDIDDKDSNKPQMKKVRFPKGKKVKPGSEFEQVKKVKVDEEELPIPEDFNDPRVAAKERAKRRGQMTTELFAEEGDEAADLSRIASAEEHYQVNETFVEDGIQIEPFNLEREREEGYFDEAGNFVEYVQDKEEKDAWLDSVEVDPKLAERQSMVTKNDDDEQEMSSDDVGKMKRRIANALEPGETVLQALKRLKGHTNDRKAKMSAVTKNVFDQLTEDAMRLMENGDYNVYHEEREVFAREAEGYEALARARNSGVSGDGDDEMDMFADDDGDAAAKTDETNQNSVQSEATGSWEGQSDYVYDEASGYYYSSSLGYYYDPSTGLYCSATSEQWYKYNEDSGTYDEVQPEPEAASNAS